ncbi:MAG: hypothetical protein INR65_11480 [Gluconacetobacter diazotrophicus]|nr:hypothetical protein [Gluconacetobacter diazotrophicus]
MATSKHPTHPPTNPDDLGADTPAPPSDLERNPGIGGSKGAYSRTGVDPETIEADNTAEGDVLNDTDQAGGVSPNKTGRTNK